MPTPIPISISVNIDVGNVTVDPSLVYASPGSSVAWTAKNGTSLTISFKNQSPFSTYQLRSQSNTLSATMDQSTAKGIYHYAVAIMGTDGKIYTIPGCPEIIVQ
jgi:plastocyanin